MASEQNQNIGDVLFRADKLEKKINEAKIRNNRFMEDLNIENNHEIDTNIMNQKHFVSSPKFNDMFQKINETLQQSHKVQLNKYELNQQRSDSQ